MKKIIRIMSVLLVFCMLFSMVACGNDTTDTDKAQETDNASDTSTQGDKEPDGTAGIIAGEFLLDATDLGMPMKWYVQVTADGNFKIATDREYTALKGEGTVRGKDGTFMLIYNDTTVEEPKTATFTYEGNNMVFSTNVPIGKASISPNTEENKYPTAKLIENEDILGTYIGTFEKAAMGSTFVYDYSIDLVMGNEYTFTSSFATADGTEYTLVETGSFDVDGTKITFAPKVIDGEAVTADAVEGTITDGTIKAAFKLSMMASSRQEVEAKLAVYADVAGLYMGAYYKEMMGTILDYTVALELDAFGGYVYNSSDNNTSDVAYSEEGTYTYADGKFTFTAATEGATPVEGTLENYVLSTKMRVTEAATMAGTLTLYGEQVYGVFTSTTEYEGKSYSAIVALDGSTFGIMVGADDAEAPAYIAVGTYTIKKAMMTTIEFTTTELYTDIEMTQAVADIPPELKTISAPVADSGINAQLPYDVDDSTVIGFQLEKVNMM